jgi:hypothetical protein
MTPFCAGPPTIHPLTDVLDDATGSRTVNDYFARDAWIDQSPAHTPTSAPRPSTIAAPNGSAQWQHPIG